MRIILASASPRRRELLSALIDDFEVIASEIEEPLIGDPVDNAERLALAKAQDVLDGNRDALVIGADTIVFDEDVSYGKPANEADVLAMWKALGGRLHNVVTAFAVLSEESARVDSDVAGVTLSDLDDEAVQAYASSGRPLDKAGAYAIQDEDVPTVKELAGCYCNVMGLPLYWLKQALEEAGVMCRDPAESRPICRGCESYPRLPNLDDER
jgi:nucleoside triphosphate pyrophosphatase